MGVLALMYHRTPPAAGHILDVAMPLFRAQIQALQAAGLRFIRFSEALDRRWYAGDTVIAITFDDGHASNLEAMAFLHNAGIPFTSFFVRDFVRRGQQGFMGLEEFKTAYSFGEVGAHGATHTALTSLGPASLDEELMASKTYLEEHCGRPVTTMSAPGGKIDRRVLHAAIKLGFEVLGDSEAMLNTAPRLPLHRICVLKGQTPEYLLSLARAGAAYWQYKNLRQTALSKAARMLGSEKLEALRRVFKGYEPR